MAYLTNYEPGTIHKTANGEWRKTTVLNLCSVKIYGKENIVAESPDDVLAAISEIPAQFVNFTDYDFPRKPVPVDDPKLPGLLRKLFKREAARVAASAA